MKNLLLTLLLLPLCLGLSSCGKNDSDDKKNQSADLVPIDDSTPSDENVDGNRTGKFVSPTPLNGVSSDAHFITSFKLENDQSITIHTYADKNLENGVNMGFSRSSEGKISVTWSGSSFSIPVTESFETKLTPIKDDLITVRIDMHNSENGGHMLVWIASESAEINKDNADFDEPVGENGSGTFWGVTLNNVELKTTKVKGPVYVH